MNAAFIDLDELILLCRTKQSKEFIKEAIDCYRAGAFRSCIVSTWNAVVFDFIFKLKELKLFGDPEATLQLSNFEKLRSLNNYKGLWDFESKIPEYALKKFELISQIEELDIKRLFEDRSRCAHPSMSSLEEPFEATAELARYHLRSAVIHLLQRPPVQGRTAHDDILQQIESENFPQDVESAVNYFQQSLLLRARHTLIKDIIVNLTVGLLTKNFSQKKTKQHFSAINAIAFIHREFTQESLNEKLSDIILRKVDDANFDKLVSYLANIKTWDFISEPCKIKLNNFIKNTQVFVVDSNGDEELDQNNANILAKAVSVCFLKQAAIDQFQLPFNNLLDLKKFYNDKLMDQILTPIAVERLPEADLDGLLSINNEESGFDRLQLQPYLLTATKNISTRALLISIFKTNIVLDGFIGSVLKEKVAKGTSKEITLARSWITDEIEDVKCKAENREILKEVIEEANRVTVRLTEETPIKELLSLYVKYSYDEFMQNCIKAKMIENVDFVVDNFNASTTFDMAGINAGFLFDVFDSLTESHWSSIFAAYTSNCQISYSWSCSGIFSELIDKYMEIEEEHVPRSLNKFREKLNKFSGRQDDIDGLKKKIDLYLNTSEQNFG
jgi:hypothetical protein